MLIGLATYQNAKHGTKHRVNVTEVALERLMLREDNGEIKNLVFKGQKPKTGTEKRSQTK